MHFVIQIETLAAGPANILVTNYIVIALLTLFTPDFDVTRSLLYRHNNSLSYEFIDSTWI